VLSLLMTKPEEVVKVEAGAEAAAVR
jgi:hypothetical protein